MRLTKDLNPAFLKRLIEAERFAGILFYITSAKRAALGKKIFKSTHSELIAVDIRCHDSKNRDQIVRGLWEAGFTRVGLYDRHVHVDASLDRVQNVLWLGGKSL